MANPQGFDVNAARQAGYSDDDILQHLTQTRNFDVQGAMKAGYSTPEIIQHLASTPTAAAVPSHAEQALSVPPGPSLPVPGELTQTSVQKANADRPLYKKILGLPANDQTAEQEKQSYVKNVQPLVNKTLNPVRPIQEGALAAKNYIQAEAASINPQDASLPIVDESASPFTAPNAGVVEAGPAVANAYKNVVAPAAEASSDFLEGQYEPQNLATLGLFKYLPRNNALLRLAQKGAGAALAVPAAKGAVEKGVSAVQAAAEGNVPEAVRQGTGAAFDTGYAAEGGADLARGARETARDVRDVAADTGQAIVKATPTAIGSRIYPESVQSTEQLARTSGREAKRQTENLSAALETGGKPTEKGVMTFEDVAQPITDAIRTEAQRQGKTEKDFEGRNGYAAGKEITSGVRAEYDQAYNRILEPLRDEYAGKSARVAAQDAFNKLASDASLIDELTNSGNLDQLTNLKNSIGSARTIGELDDMRQALNRLGSRYMGKAEGQQFQSPILQEALSSAADSIRSALYKTMEQRYGGATVNGESQGITEPEIRQLQREHGAAIKADQLMEQSARALSSAESEHQSPPSVFRRLFGTAYRATLSRTPHAAAGVLERLFPGSKLDDFNTQMKRVLKGGEAGGYKFPEPPQTGEYVEPNSQGPTNTVPGNLKLKAAPPFAEQLPPEPQKALPPGPENALPPGQYEQPPSNQFPRRLGPARLPQRAAPASNAVEPVGIPATAEPSALQSHFEAKGPSNYRPAFLGGKSVSNSVPPAEMAQNRSESVPPTTTSVPTVEAAPAQEAPRRSPLKFIPQPAPQLSTGERVSGLEGKPTNLLTSSGQMGARYRIVEAPSLVASHDAMTFAKNGQYPEGVQERAYHSSKEAQNRVIQQAQNYEPAYTVNSNPDAVNGPPVVTPDGMVLGGNSRTMSTQRLYGTGKGEAYKSYLRDHAADFGFTPEQVDGMKQPVLVREVAAPGSVEEARRVGSELNKSMTGALGVSEKAVSAGKSITPESLGQISSMMDETGEGSSLRDLLRDRGRDVVQMLSRDGVITERERPAYVDTATGGLSEEGKTFVERALRGSVVGDPDLMDRTPKNVLAKIDSSLGDLASVGSRPDEYNIMPVVRAALFEHGEAARKGVSIGEHFGDSIADKNFGQVKQEQIFTGEKNPLAESVARALAEKPTAVRARFKQFAQDAKFDMPGQQTLGMGGERPSAVDAFNAAFGTKLSQDQFVDGIIKAYRDYGNENSGTIPPNGQNASSPESGENVGDNSRRGTEGGDSQGTGGTRNEAEAKANAESNAASAEDEASQSQNSVSRYQQAEREIKAGRPLSPELLAEFPELAKFAPGGGVAPKAEVSAPPNDYEEIKKRIAELEAKKSKPAPFKPIAKQVEAQKSAANKALVDKFRTMADSLDKQIEDKQRPNTQNPTPKRNAQEASRRFDARNLERTQRALRALADAHENGTIAPELAPLRTKDQIQTLVRKYLTGEGGYYGRVESNDYADKSAAGVKLQGMIDGSMTPEQIAKRENANKLRNLEQQVSLSNIPSFFPTPKPVVSKMLDAADIKPGMSVLEPSAGKGDIADAVKEAVPDAKIDTVEQNYNLGKILELKGHNLAGTDFMEHEGQYDRIVMNPPFEKGADMDHVRRAFDMLKPGGKMVSIMGPHFEFGSEKKSVDFRNWLESVGGEVEKLPESSFKSSGTSVGSRMVVIDKPEQRDAVDEASQSKGSIDLERSSKIPSMSRRGAGDKSTQPKIETPAGADWNEGNKLVTKSGKPRVFYHGTAVGQQIDDFRPSRDGRVGPGIYLSHRAGGAEDYASGGRGFAPPNQSPVGGAIYPVHARMSNPLVVREDRDGIIHWRKITEQFGVDDRGPELWQKIREAGHDGIIIKSKDGFDDEFVVFSPKQVRSTLSGTSPAPSSGADLDRIPGPHGEPDSRLLYLARNAKFGFKPPEGRLPGHVNLNGEANQLAQIASGRRFVGTNASVAGATRMIAKLDDYAEQLRPTNPDEADKLKQFADTLENATHETDGLTLVMNQPTKAEKIRTVHEELTHAAVQRRPGSGDIEKGIPYQQMLSDPSIQAEHPKIESYDPVDQIRAVAESFVDWLNGEHSLKPEEAQKSAETYLNHLAEAHGIQPVQDAGRVYDYVDQLAQHYGLVKAGEQFDGEATAPGRRAIANVLGRAVRRGSEERGTRSEEQAVGRESESVAGRKPDTDNLPSRNRTTENSAENGGRRTVSSGNGTGLERGPQRGTLEWGGGGLADDQIDTFAKKGLQKIEEAGEQDNLFRAAEKMYRLVRTDSDGLPEKALVTKAQLERLARAYPRVEKLMRYAGIGAAPRRDFAYEEDTIPSKPDPQGTLFRSGIPKFLRPMARR